MRIATLNIWGGRNSTRLKAWLNTTNADIYCFQEVFSSSTYGNFLLEDGDGYIIETDLLTRLKDALPQYNCFFSTGSRGYVNDSTWVGFEMDYGTAIFVRADWAVSISRSSIVHGPFRYKNEGKPPLSRAAQVIRCITPEGPLVIGNIHGLWDPSGKQDTTERVTQAEKFAELIDEVASLSDPIILCGDFNLMPESSTFALLHNSPLKNLVTEFKITSTRTELYKKQNRFADYVLVNNMLTIHKFKVPQSPILSDHCPLILDTQIKLQKRVEENARQTDTCILVDV